MYRRLVLGCNDKILLISNVTAKCRFIDGVCKFCDAHHLGLRRWGETMNLFCSKLTISGKMAVLRYTKYTEKCANLSILPF